MKEIPQRGNEQQAAASQARGDRAAPSVVFVISQFLPLLGGAEIQALREARALRAAGHDVRVVTLRWNADLPVSECIEGVPVRRTGGVFVHGRLRLRSGLKWLAELALWGELIRSRREYLIVHLRQLNGFARPVALAALLTGKPLLVRLGSAGPVNVDSGQGGDDPRLCAGSLDPGLPFLRVPRDPWVGGDVDSLYRTQRLAGLTMRLLKRRNVTFVATSTRLHAYLTHHGIRSEQIALLPNGVDLDGNQEAAARITARLEQSLPEAPTVICVSRLSYAKGVDVLLQAWREVHASLPTARLVIVGGGSLQPNLEAIATALDLGTSVRFAGASSDVRSFLLESDLFVLPSRWEGMPNALLEAMAWGLPCIATRVSGAEDAIVDGESGLLVPTEDPAALARAMLALLTDRQRARTFGLAARARITQYFNQRTLTAQLSALYRRAAG